MSLVIIPLPHPPYCLNLLLTNTLYSPSPPLLPLLLQIVDGNMLIKMAVKDTPALLGNKLKTYYHKVYCYIYMCV